MELEGNEKHVQELLRCTGMETCKPVNSPMTAEDFRDDDRKKTEAQLKVLPQGAARLYRRGTALAVYMSQDRLDLSAAACQLATRMQEPTEYDWERLKRLCRYVKGCPRCVLCYPWQHQESTTVKLTTDSDWANEARTRKSHSGGMLQVGHHLVQHWVQTATSYRVKQRGSRVVQLCSNLAKHEPHRLGFQKPTPYQQEQQTAKHASQRTGEGRARHGQDHTRGHAPTEQGHTPESSQQKTTQRRPQRSNWGMKHNEVSFGNSFSTNTNTSEMNQRACTR